MNRMRLGLLTIPLVALVQLVAPTPALAANVPQSQRTPAACADTKTDVSLRPRVRHDNDNNETKITYPASSVVVSQQFDADENVCWIYVGSSTNSCASPPSEATTYTRDHNENITVEALPNGVNNDYTWDDANNISGISDGTSGSVFAATYSRNADNLISKDTSQPSNNDYMKYTSKNQICYAGSANSAACSSPPANSYPYADDAAGNLTTNNGSTQAYNTGSGTNSDELCWSVSGSSSNTCGSGPTGSTAYGFNTNGARTSAVPSSGSATCFSYNTLIQLTEIQTGTGSSCTTPTTVGTYTDDGRGLRASKTVGANTTNYSWNDTGSVPVLLQETTGSNTTSYVNGPLGPVAEILPSGATDYYSRDALGSTRALTNSSGTVLNTDTYTPFGTISASTGSTQNNLLFQGMYLDSESGLYYDQARYYDPTTAEFLTIDPAVEQTQQPYSFTNDDPTNAADPNGDMIACDDGGGCGNALTATERTETPVSAPKTYASDIKSARSEVVAQENHEAHTIATTPAPAASSSSAGGAVASIGTSLLGTATTTVGTQLSTNSGLDGSILNIVGAARTPANYTKLGDFGSGLSDIIGPGFGAVGVGITSVGAGSEYASQHRGQSGATAGAIFVGTATGVGGLLSGAGAGLACAEIGPLGVVICSAIVGYVGTNASQELATDAISGGSQSCESCMSNPLNTIDSNDNFDDGRWGSGG